MRIFLHTLSKPASIYYVMTNTKSNATPELTTTILRGIEDRFKRINPEDRNSEGLEALRDVRTALEDLVDAVTAHKLLESLGA